METSTPHHYLIPLLSLALLTLPGLKAQDQGETNNSTNAAQGTNSCSQGSAQKCRHHHEEFANLTAAERQELRADMQKIESDPQLQAARDAVKQAVQSLKQVREQLLLQVDPSVQPILDKLNQGTNAPTAPSGN